MGHASESSAMAIQRKQRSSSGFSTPPQCRLLGKTNPYANTKCPVCGDLGHSKQRCYEVIGYPDWWDFTKKPRKNLGKAVMATTEETQPTSASANVAQSGHSDSADSWLWCQKGEALLLGSDREWRTTVVRTSESGQWSREC
ncbi:uncharacterized protein LOC133713388 isoform X2 [Rosa rugosa]|uniref:uncharacterized protein LOC133713388 isoform X2 n=1 Tax=Rosa rugosa TaxID=74645 RepID=UPI002B41486A|nr:uncharacterized protein LOC133713388 isoform X2 [Rosa rugosa]